MKKIGTATITRLRVYAYDRDTNRTCPYSHDPRQLTVQAKPGVYELFQSGKDTFVWKMPVRFSTREAQMTPLGDGMFAMSGGDMPYGPEFSCVTKDMTAEDLYELHHNSNGAVVLDIPSGAVAL